MEPVSNTRSIRGSRGGDVPIKRRGRDAEAVRDLRHADVGIGKQRSRDIEVVFGEFRRSTSGATCAASSGEARLGSLPDQTPLELR